jgi:hypothetical protein
MKAIWEWTVEHIDEHDDIQANDFYSLLRSGHLMTTPIEGCIKVRVAAVRYYGTAEQGESERDYFYVGESGFMLHLPAWMQNQYWRAVAGGL